MGTRHFVEVISDGKKVISQYGQWDGYPTTAGVVICDFIKNHDMDEFKKILGRLEPAGSPDEFQWTECCFGAEHPYSDIQRFCSNYKAERKFEYTILELVRACVDAFGPDVTKTYFMITRDTGYNILDILCVLNDLLDTEAKIPVFTSERGDEVPGNSYWLEALYVINLDTKVLTINWHGNEKVCRFSRMPGESTLSRFEKQRKYN